MLAKITDAVSMLWQAFDARERLLAIYVALAAASWLLSLALAGVARARARREARIARLVAEELAAEAA